MTKAKNGPMQSGMNVKDAVGTDTPASTTSVRPMHQSPRCGARTRSNTRCRAPAVKGKRRCRMHGGAYGSGGQRGNQNAYRHGAYAKDIQDLRRMALAMLRRLGVEGEDV